jgi:hypothetical protein
VRRAASPRPPAANPAHAPQDYDILETTEANEPIGGDSSGANPLVRSGSIKKPDHGHCRLLRPRRERPSRRAAEKRDEVSALVAVGTLITERPPRGSVRAAFPHTGHHVIFVVLCLPFF